MKSKILYLVQLLTIIFTFLGCESKFYESSPTKVKSDGRSLDARITQKKEIDVSITEIQRGLSKIKSTFDLIKKIQNPSSPQEEIYSPLELIFDINKELKSKIPDYHDEKMLRHAQLKISGESTPDACKNIDTRLETNTTSIASEDGKIQTGKRINYFIKTCYSLGKYELLLTAEWKQQGLEMKLNNETVSSLFKMLVIETVPKNANCKIVKNAQSVIERFSCEDIEIILSKNESALAKSLVFTSGSETEIELVAELYENKNKTSYLNLKKLSNGKIYRDLRKVSE